jgi:hypothetical protein
MVEQFGGVHALIVNALPLVETAVSVPCYPFRTNTLLYNT